LKLNVAQVLVVPVAVATTRKPELGLKLGVDRDLARVRLVATTRKPELGLKRRSGPSRCTARWSRRPENPNWD